MKRAFLLILIGYFLGGNYSHSAIAEQNIGALGYIAPAGGIIELSGPAGDIIEEILVKRGDVVDKGFPLVIFRGNKEKELDVALKRGYLKEADELGLKRSGVRILCRGKSDKQSMIAILMP